MESMPLHAADYINTIVRQAIWNAHNTGQSVEIYSCEVGMLNHFPPNVSTDYRWTVYL